MPFLFRYHFLSLPFLFYHFVSAIMAQEEVCNGVVEKSVTFTAFKPQLTVEAHKVGDAVQFYKSAFGAVESAQSLYPKRKADQELPHILSAELQLAGSTIVISDASAHSETEKIKGNTITLCLETEDVEAAVGKAVAAGAVKEAEVSEKETEGVQKKVKDPYGFTWIFCSPAKKIEKAENEGA